jgi:hypothetical protein
VSTVKPAKAMERRVWFIGAAEDLVGVGWS